MHPQCRHRDHRTPPHNQHLPQHRLRLTYHQEWLGRGLHRLECRQGMYHHPKLTLLSHHSQARYFFRLRLLVRRYMGFLPSCCLIASWRLECRLQPLRGRVSSWAFVVVVFLIDKSSSRARANIKFCRWDRKICLDLLSKAGKNYGF